MLSNETKLLLDMQAELRNLRNEAKAMFSAAAEEVRPLTHRKFAGLDIKIENPKGSIRSGVNKKGVRWRTKMNHDYGFFSRGLGEDGEGLDVFLGHNPNPTNVYIVNQNDDDGNFDEQKALLGFDTPAQAKAAYLSNYDTPKYFRSMTIIPLATFKKMLTKAEPGSVHWKKKMARGLDTSAMFSANTTDLMRESAKVLKELHALAYDDTNWVTIGAQPGADGKKHGGTPVKVGQGGEIDAGPKALKGRTISSLKKKLSPSAKPHSMTGTQTSAGTDSLRKKFDKLGSPESMPVRVDDDLRTAAQLGRLTIPVHGGEIDPHLEDAYRRAAEAQGVKLGEFKVNPDTGHATAQIGDHDDDVVGETPFNPELLEAHPMYDKALGDFIRHHGGDMPEIQHPEPQTEEEIARAVNRGDIPVERVLESHPHLAGNALVQQHQREKLAELEASKQAEEEQAQQQAEAGEPVAGENVDPQTALRQRIDQLKAKGMPSSRAAVRARIELEKEGVLEPRTPNAPQNQPQPPQQPRQLDPELRKVQEQEQALAAKLREGKANEQQPSRSESTVPADGEPGGEGAGSVQGTEPGGELGQPHPTEPPAPEAEPMGAGEAGPEQQVEASHEPPKSQPVDTGVPDSSAPEGDRVERQAPGEGATQGKAPKANRPLSKSAIERTLMAHLDETSGESEQDIEDDKALSGYHAPYTFLRTKDTKSGYPGEIEHFLEKGPGKRMRRLFSLTDDPAKAQGDDAMRDLGQDKYLNLVERRGDMTGRVPKALEAAKNSPDPQMRLLAAIYETMPPAKERVPQESVPAAELQPGEEMRINGIPVEVKENEDGERLLTDGGDLPDVPVDALDGLQLPVDRGSRREKTVPDDLDPFGDIMDEPEPQELKPNAANDEPQEVPAGDAGVRPVESVRDTESGAPEEDPIAETWRQQASKASTPRLKRGVAEANKWRSDNPNGLETQQLQDKVLADELRKRGVKVAGDAAPQEETHPPVSAGQANEGAGDVAPPSVAATPEIRSSPPSTADVNKAQSANLNYRKPVDINAMDAMLDRRMARKNTQRFGKRPQSLASAMRQQIPKVAEQMRQEKPSAQFSPDVGKQLKDRVDALQTQARQQGKNLPFTQAIKLAKRELGFQNFSALDDIDRHLDRLIASTALLIA